ncbi:MAG: hypothetical protein K8H90_02150, partial [Thermoanaerobaculia bacterium]|nr:hypothetical protein [Thermoanaerobaculia bacterium]
PEATVEVAVSSLVTRDARGPDGRFVPGNGAAVTHGARSELLLDALAPARRELAARVRADLGLDEQDAPATLDAMIGAFAEASLLRRALFVKLTSAGGPISAKGRVKAAVQVYFNALDREQRLAALIGLERKARHVPIGQVVAEAAAKSRERAA